MPMPPDQEAEFFRATTGAQPQSSYHIDQSNAPFRPILDRVLIRRIEPEAVADGFTVPEKYRQHTNKGEVIALGDGVVLGGDFRPLTDFLAVGDKCLYGEYTSEAFEKDGETLYIVRIQDIRGVQRA